MGRLTYTVLMSLDGYVADASGGFDWAAPDEEVHAFVNDLERSAGTYLYGRRMYEVMTAWEDDPALADHSPVTRDYADMWRAADKIVYSRLRPACAPGGRRCSARSTPRRSVGRSRPAPVT